MPTITINDRAGLIAKSNHGSAAATLIAGQTNASLFSNHWHWRARAGCGGSACNSSRALPMRSAVCALVQQLSLATPAQLRSARKPFQLF